MNDLIKLSRFIGTLGSLRRLGPRTSAFARFDGLDLGKYFVQVKAPVGQADPAPVSLTKGMDARRTDGVLSGKPPPQPAPGKPLPGLPGQLPPALKKS